MASLQYLLFFSMGCFITTLLAFTNQSPMGSFITVAIGAVLFVLIPCIFFSAITLLIRHVTASESTQPPLLPVFLTKHFPTELKSLGSTENPSVLTLTISMSGLLLFDSLSISSNQNPNNFLIYSADHTFLYIVLLVIFFSAMFRLIYQVNTSRSPQPPLAPEHTLMQFKSKTSIRNLSIVALAVSFSGLLLFDSLSTSSSQKF